MILGEVEFTGYRKAEGGWVSAGQQGEHDSPVRVPADQVEKQGEHFVLRDAPKIRVESRAYKMSKSRGNVVNPDQVVRDFGADSLRLYEMFMGPLEATKPWSTTGVGGVRGFLDRCWRLVVDERAEEVAIALQVCDDPPSDEALRELHRTIDTQDDGGYRQRDLRTMQGSPLVECDGQDPSRRACSECRTPIAAKWRPSFCVLPRQLGRR
jgi:leucyl-tRNA synthetase